MLATRPCCARWLDVAGAVSILRAVHPDAVLPRPPRALVRLDRWAIERLTLAVIPLRLGARAERALVGLVIMSFAAAQLLPPEAAAVPSRVVHIAGIGWVDARAAAGLPATALDGEQWTLRGVEAAPVGRIEPAPVELTAATRSLAAGAKLSLNRATAEELEALPGIGPALAARIVAARPFGTVAALDRVRGIGPRTYAKLAPLLEL